MDYAQILSRIFDNLEEGRVDRAVMGCLRIARHIKDYVNAATFLRELYPDKTEVGNMIHDDMNHLKPESKKFVYEISFNRWLEVHTLDFSLGSSETGARKTVLKVGIGEINSELEQWERSIDDMKLPQGMDPFDLAAFTDQQGQLKAEIRLRMKAMLTIRERVRARCLNYVIQIEKQLDLQKVHQGFLESVQNDVNNYFKSHSEDVFAKLKKSAELAASKDLEDASLLLTEVRRALKAIADHFYQPAPGKVLCADGIERKLGEDQYLNRLQEFLATGLPRSTSSELLKVELEHLGTFIRRLNDMASKGVHDVVTLAESRQGLVGLYFFLHNLILHLTSRT